MLQFRKINGKPINAISCILTGNLPDEKVYGNTISTALLDRGSKYLLQFDFQQWLDWAKANNVNDLILGFLRSNQQFACNLADESIYASPTPRGWTMASHALDQAKQLKMLDLDSITQIVSGYVGSQAGLMFKVWYEHYRKFETPVRLLIEKNEMTIKWEDLIPTEKLIFIVSACYYTKQKVLDKGIKSKCTYLERLCAFFSKYDVAPEMQVLGLNNSFSFEIITKYKLYNCKTFFDLFSKLSQGVTFKK